MFIPPRSSLNTDDAKCILHTVYCLLCIAGGTEPAFPLCYVATVALVRRVLRRGLLHIISIDCSCCGDRYLFQLPGLKRTRGVLLARLLHPRRGSHIQRIGCQPEITKYFLHGGQSRSWSAETGKDNKKIKKIKKSGSVPPPSHAARYYYINILIGENK